MGRYRNLRTSARKIGSSSLRELAKEIPSHDTFVRVFTRLDPEQFQQSFLSWVKSISNVIQGEVIAIDGKTLRHYKRSFWVSKSNSHGFVLGQQITDWF